MPTMKAEIDRLYAQATRGSRRTETLDYVRSLLGQLRTMVEAERCDMLTYLIEMAYVEASDIVRDAYRRDRKSVTRKVA